MSLIVQDLGNVPPDAASNLSFPALDFNPSDWSVPKAAKLFTRSDGIAFPPRQPVNITIRIDPAGTTDGAYSAIAGSAAGSVSNVLLPLREVDEVGVSVLPREVTVAVTQTAPGSASYTFRDALLRVKLSSRPTAAVQIDCVVNGSVDGFLSVTGGSRRDIEPADWREEVSFTLRSSPGSVLPSDLTETVVISGGSIDLEFSSTDAEYDSAS